MAKKRRRRATRRRAPRRAAPRRRSRRRSYAAAPRRRRRRSSIGGVGRRLMPAKHELLDYAGAGAYGFLEKAAAAGDVPQIVAAVAKTPLPQVGFAGNVAIAARIANHFAKNKYLGHFAHGAAMIATYQLVRRGALFTAAAPATISGDYDDDISGEEIDGEELGALSAEGDMAGDEDDLSGDDIEGVPFDEPVGDANDTMSGG